MTVRVLSICACLACVCLTWSVSTAAAERRFTDRVGVRTEKVSSYESKVSETAGDAARRWGLTVEEYRRYESLMKGVRGAFSQPNISPIEVLGIHARTPQERRRYAERLVRILYEDTERVLAFEREVQAAWRRLGAPMFEEAEEEAPFPSTVDELLGRLQGRRLAVFTSTSRSCKACRERIGWLLSFADRLPGLDLYVIDTDEAWSIGEFAKEIGVPRELVDSKRVTLNRGRRLFSAYRGDLKVPAAFVRVGNRLIRFGGGR